MICKNCNSQVADGTKFCNNCGKPVDETNKSKVDIEKLKKHIKNTGESVYAVGWITIGLNVIIYLWSILDKNFFQSGLAAPDLAGVIVLVVCGSVFVILGRRIKKLVDKSIKLYLQVSLGLFVLVAIWVIATGGRIGLLFFFVVIYLAGSIGDINRLLKQDEFTSTLTSPKYYLYGSRWAIFAVIAIILFFVAVGLGSSAEGSLVQNSQGDNPALSTEEYIRQAVKEAKTQTTFPNQIDSVTTFTDIIAEPNAIRYQYVLHDLDTSNLSNESLKNSIIGGLCKNETMTDIMNRGIGLEYSYAVKDTQQTFFMSFSKEDCLVSQLPASPKTAPLNINDLPKDSYASVKTTPVQVESPQLKIERCRALATSQVSEQNFLTIEQRVEALNKCNEPEWMFPDEKQPAYMTDVEWKDMLKRVCIQKLNTSLDELVEKEKNDAYSKYYSDCLNK